MVASNIVDENTELLRILDARCIIWIDANSLPARVMKLAVSVEIRFAYGFARELTVVLSGTGDGHSVHVPFQ